LSNDAVATAFVLVLLLVLVVVLVLECVSNITSTFDIHYSIFDIHFFRVSLSIKLAASAVGLIRLRRNT
jgi:hypothetical protein